MGSDHRKHLRYERVEKAADSTFLKRAHTHTNMCKHICLLVTQDGSEKERVPWPRFPHLPQRRGLPDEEHVDDAEVLDDAHAGEEGERRHLHHRDGAAAVRTAGAQRARTSLRQRTGAL